MQEQTDGRGVGGGADPVGGETQLVTASVISLHSNTWLLDSL